MFDLSETWWDELEIVKADTEERDFKWQKIEIS